MEQTFFQCNHSYEKLSQNELDEIEQRMYPGHCSQAGFLQGEKLRDVYEKDKKYLENQSISLLNKFRIVLTQLLVNIMNLVVDIYFSEQHNI